MKFQKEVNISAYLEGLRKTIAMSIADNKKVTGGLLLEELSEKSQ
jgi:hypothetical protein